MNPVIRVVDLWKNYRGNDTSDTAALRGTSLEVTAGELVGLYGKSGSGKTTLLNLLAGLDCPTRGVVEIEGKRLDTLGERMRAQLRRTRIGFVFQFFNLLPTLTVFENVFLSLELAGREEKGPVRDALKAVGLESMEGRFPHELSGGEQQRVAIARAMVKNPSLLLADEPTGNLDSHTGTQVLTLLEQRCRESGTTLVVATHSPLTCRHVDRVLRMEDGKITETVPCEEIDW